MTDYAALIKDAVPMDAVLRQYGLVGRTQTHRIPCPIHGGVKNNFSFHGHTYKCFVCGSQGSTIDFVMQYRNLPFVEAMQEINTQFGLGFPIGSDYREPSEAEREAQRKAERLRRERTKRQNRLKLLCTAFDAAMDRYALLDIIVCHDAPQGPYDEITPQYEYALKHIDAAWEEVQDAAERLREFEREGE